MDPATRNWHTPRTNTCNVDRLTDAVYGTVGIAHGLVGVPVIGWTIDEI